MNYTVLVTAYNEEENLHRCLEAINAQTVPPKIKVLIDDGSTDRTSQIAKFYGFPVQAVTGSKLKEGYMNRARAFNVGVTALYARGGLRDYVFKVDADIVPPPKYAETLIIAAEKNKKIGVASGVSEDYTNRRFVSNGAILYRSKPLHYAPVRYGWDRHLALNIVKKGYRMYIDTGLKYVEMREPRIKKPPLHKVLYNRLEAAIITRGRTIVV